MIRTNSAFLPCLFVLLGSLMLDASDTVAQQLELVGDYTFDKVTNEKPNAVNQVAPTDETTLRYVAKEPLVITSDAGQHAVQIDQGYYESKPEAFSDAPFTIEMRFRKRGHGSLDGNSGSRNGMLFALGDGYWAGLRCYVDDQNRLQFQIGRAKPSSAISLTSDSAIADGVWNHIACAWNGSEMRLWINGVPAGSQAFAGPLIVDPNHKFRIGYAGAGIGSNRMDVDRLRVYRGVLPDAEIVQSAWSIDASDNVPLDVIADLMLRLKDDASESTMDELSGMVDDEQLPNTCRLRLRLLLADQLMRQNRYAAAVTELMIVGSESDDGTLRDRAARGMIKPEHGAVRADAPASIYEHLLRTEPAIAPQQQVDLKIALAERCFRDGQADRAIAIYDQLLANDELTKPQRFDIASQRLECVALSQASDSPLLRKTQEDLMLIPLAKEYAQIEKNDVMPIQPDSANRLGIEWATPPKPGVEYYVDLDSETSNKSQQIGSSLKPFATLEQSRDAIRQLKQSSGLPEGGVTTWVRGRIVTPDVPFQLEAMDSGEPGRPIVYREWPVDQKSIESNSTDWTNWTDRAPGWVGGVDLTDWTAVSDPAILQRLPESARDKVLQCDLRAAGIDNLGQLNNRGMGCATPPVRPWVDLYVNDRAIMLSRWPNPDEDPLIIGKVYRGEFQTPDANKSGEFEFSHERTSRWLAANDVWMDGMWGHLWGSRTVPVEKIDRESGRIHGGAGSGYGFRTGQPFYFINLLEEIDQPDEWYLDRESGILYIWPPEDIDLASSRFRARIPVSDKPYVEMRKVHHVMLEGLLMELNRADAVIMTDCYDCVLAGCVIRHLGGNAVTVNGGERCGVIGSDLYSLGACGVRLRGGDRETLRPGDHYVRNCQISDFSRVDRSYAPAVYLDGVRHWVCNNEIYESPHHAMRIEGDLHVVMGNDVHHVVYEFDDQAGIDMWGDPTFRGNRFVWNFWHDIGSGLNVAGQSGIRLDDAISNVWIYGNVFYRCAGGKFGGVQIHGGKDNIVQENLFIECNNALSFSQWSEQRWTETLARSDFQDRIQRGTTPERLEQFPDLNNIPANPNRNWIMRNVAVNCGQFAVRDRGVNVYAGNDMYSGDLSSLGFRDPKNNDLTLLPDSGILKHSSIHSVDFKEIGPEEDADYRRGLMTRSRCSAILQHER